VLCRNVLCDLLSEVMALPVLPGVIDAKRITAIMILAPQLE
jgi:hypothetical protein